MEEATHLKCFENEYWYFDLERFCMYRSNVIAVLFLVFGFSVRILNILWKLVVGVGIQLECTRVMSADAKRYSTKSTITQLLLWFAGSFYDLAGVRWCVCSQCCAVSRSLDVCYKPPEACTDYL